MENKVTPAFFYGSVASVVAGLALGMALHGPWESKLPGPQLLFSRAEAAEVAPPSDDGALIEASDTTDASLYDGFLPATPLPVTRLQPDRYPDLFARWNGGVTQASAGDTERVNADDLYREPVFDTAMRQEEASEPTDHAEVSAVELPSQPVPYSRF